MKVLAIGAHFDDVELGCGGTLLKHRDAGDEIHILVITHSGYTNNYSQHTRSAKQALEEGKESAEMLGATLHCMGEETLEVVASELLVLKIDRFVQEIQPDRVYTHRPSDNHSDHAAIGFASLRAARHCKEVLLYRSNWYIIDQPEKDNYYVDISKYIDEKKKLVSLFKSELEKINYSWIKFFEMQNQAAGSHIHTDYSETFHVMKLVW